MAPSLRRADAAALVLVAGLAALVHVFPSAAPVRDLAQDTLVRLATTFPPAPPPGAPDALIVAIDSLSLRELSDWPWPRRRWAALARTLQAAGAAAICRLNCSEHLDRE